MAIKWWKKNIVYQIYPKSFNDSNGDGIGDLNGITEKMDYLKDLGVDVIWISPMYCSPMDDNGYDISDYYKVDLIFGSDEDMDRLLNEAQKRNMKIILDLVVNHCSDEHEWFKKAKKDPNCEEADYFYFTRTANNKEPNNWRSNFGGSVWSQLPDGRWYYHTFSPKQPDLNWENPKLRNEVYRMINWWLDKGVAGFRVDAISFIKKDLTFKSRKTDDGLRYPVENFYIYPGIGEFLTEMRDKTFARYDCMTVAEAFGVSEDAIGEYAGENGYFSMVFDFEWENMADERDKSSIEAVERWKKKIFNSQRSIGEDAWIGIFLENHDQSRCVNRYLEEKDRSFFSASAMATMYFFLRGTPFIYQGQEIGMTNATWYSIDEMDDVRAKRMYKEAIEQNQDAQKIFEHFSESGRDNARTPMQWDNSINAGFSTGKPWLKVHENYVKINVADQEQDAKSLLSYYKRLTRLHHAEPYQEIFADGAFRPILEKVPGIIAYERVLNDQIITVVVNYTNQQHAVIKDNANCLLNNYRELHVEGKKLLLLPYQAVVLYGKL